MSKLYSSEDIKIMEEGIDKIIEKARIQELEISEPTLKQYIEISN